MLLRGAYLTMHRRFNAHFKPHGITADQFVLLSTLDEYPGCSQRRLAELCFTDANTIAAMLRLLESKGLVVRGADPADGRAFVLNLTAAGRALRELCHQSSRQLHAQLAASVPAAERDRFAANLDAIRAAMTPSAPLSARPRDRRSKTPALP